MKYKKKRKISAARGMVGEVRGCNQQDMIPTIKLIGKERNGQGTQTTVTYVDLVRIFHREIQCDGQSRISGASNKPNFYMLTCSNIQIVFMKQLPLPGIQVLQFP